jgi:DNA-binding NarL/FixJ family response regulator
MVSVASPSPRIEPIRVLVTDNTPMGAELLAGTLKRDRRFQVIGTVSLPDEILTVARTLQPDIVILTHLDEGSPARFRTARELRASLPNLRLVIILDSSERPLVVEAFRAGARGILCRNMSVKSLGKCLECVHENQIWATCLEMQYVVDALVESPPIRLADSKGIPLLTKQEHAVVHWITEGLSNREIAAQLKLSEHTVKNYIFRIFDKLGVSKRVEVILYALNQRELARETSSSLADNSSREDRLLFQWCRTQAEQGAAAAAFMLGQMYRDGRGTEKDHVSSYAWFLSAPIASNEFQEAGQVACEHLAKRMTQKEITAALARVADLRGVRRGEAASHGITVPVELPFVEVNSVAPGNGKNEGIAGDVREIG